MDFQSRLQALGIDPSEVKAGPVHKQIEVKDIETLRSVIAVNGDLETRRSRFGAIFGATSKGQDADLRAAEEYVFGLTDDLSTTAQGHNPAFPVTVYADAAEALVLDKELDLSTPSGEVRRATYSTVTIKTGGYIVAKATPLDFTCDTLILEAAPPAGKGHFNILGKKGMEHATFDKPRKPDQTPAGTISNCNAGSVGGIGNKGTCGTDGTNGARGNNGVPSQLANIEINIALTVTGAVKLIVATQSGPGGNGQDGQDGGDAGQGGNGGPGAVCGCSGRNGGSGQIGGTGGTGGRAGDGGDGVDAAAHISLMVPAADFTKINQTALFSDASPGKAGARGTAGAAGAGGAAGAAASKDSSAGKAAGKGGDGVIGGPGVDGTKYGKPAQFTPHPT